MDGFVCLRLVIFFFLFLYIYEGCPFSTVRKKKGRISCARAGMSRGVAMFMRARARVPFIRFYHFFGGRQRLVRSDTRIGTQGIYIYYIGVWE